MCVYRANYQFILIPVISERGTRIIKGEKIIMGDLLKLQDEHVAALKKRFEKEKVSTQALVDLVGSMNAMGITNNLQGNVD